MNPFLTTDLNDLAALGAARATSRMQPREAVEAAWCFELHANLSRLWPNERDLIVMGGHATFLRVAALGAQRGSRDIDFIVRLSTEEIEGLVRKAASSMKQAAAAAGMSTDGLFEPEVYTPTAATLPLDMDTFVMRAPSPIVLGKGPKDVQVKAEFHRVPPGAWPESDVVKGAPYGLAGTSTVRIPRLPWQIALKLATLRTPPIGIPDAREDRLPHQIHDLDFLFAEAARHPKLDYLGPAESHDTYERAVHGMAGSTPDQWRDTQSRLSALAERITTRDLPEPYGSFERSQPGRARRLGEGPAWRARIRRVQVAVGALGAGSFSDEWPRLCAAAALVEGPQGKAIYRKALASRGMQRMAPLHAYWEVMAGSDRAEREVVLAAVNAAHQA